MKQLFLIIPALIISNSLIAQQENLFASSRKDSSGIFIGDMRASEQVQSLEVARKYAITNLKKDLEGLDKNNKSSLLADIGNNNDQNLNSEIYATYLARLDKKYKGDIRSIETDNIRDIFQIEQKSDIKKRHSSVISAQCFSSKNEGLRW